MSVNFEDVLLAPSRALNFIEAPDRRKILEEFLSNITPYTEAATRKFLEQLTREINSKLDPHIQLRLNVENNNVTPEVVTSNQDNQNDGVNFFMDDRNLSHVLLRMPEAVKQQAKTAAKTTGLSLNKWAVYALQRSAKNLDRAAETLLRTHEYERNADPQKENDPSTN